MLENICIRILILDISEKKSNHELYGFTVHEEYNFYIKHFWKNESYKCDLAIRYAEGSRLQKLKEKYFVILQNEINEKINIDKDMISKKFHENMNEFQMLNKDIYTKMVAVYQRLSLIMAVYCITNLTALTKT